MPPADPEPAKAVLQGGVFPQRASSLEIYKELKATVQRPEALRQASTARERPCPSLVPIFLAIQGTSLAPPGPDVRENFLWRLGGPWGPAAAAKRICAELGLQPSSEALVTDQIKNGLRRYDNWPAGDPCVQRKRRVLLEVVVDVTLDGLRLKDRMLWDPYSTFNDTAAHDMAAVTCADLGLPGQEWPRAIADCILEQVETKWAAVLEELRQREEAKESVEGPTAAEWVEPADGSADASQWAGPQLQWLPPDELDKMFSWMPAQAAANGETHMDTS